MSAKSEDIDLLNDAGGDGWELVAILPNNISYLKRALEDDGTAEREEEASSEEPVGAPEGPRILSADRFEEEVRTEVKAKYRDPVTGETWSGRGRMATWLKRKQDAGEDIDRYLAEGSVRLGEDASQS